MPEKERATEVPWTDLSPETLRNLAEEFVTRDGTDYGATEKTLEQKVESLLSQLRSGDAHIYYESESNSINIVASRSLR